MNFERASVLAKQNIHDWLPGGKWENRNYVVRNPRRADRKAGSFSIRDDGVGGDFADDGVRFGDWIDAFSYCAGLDDVTKAVQEIEKRYLNPADKDAWKKHAQNNKPEKQEWIPTVPVPENAGPPPCWMGIIETEKKDLRAYGKDQQEAERIVKFIAQKNGVFGPCRTIKASHLFPYLAADKSLIMFTARFDLGGGKKDVVPFTYGNTEKGTKWRSKHHPALRPIYGLDRLAANPKARVLVVEGEKKCDAAKAVLTEWVVVSWCGGSNAYQLTDWSPLEGREVHIWPDNDVPGGKAAAGINLIIGGKAKIVNVPKDKPQGWDVDDAINEELNILGIIEAWPDIPFRAIGSTGDSYYFMSGRNFQIIEVKSSALHSKGTYQSIAPLDYWLQRFPLEKKTGLTIDTDMASEELIEMAKAAGAYEPSRIRGRGFWKEDDGRYIFHLGDKILDKGSQIPILNYASKNIYYAGPKINIGTKAACEDEGYELANLCKMASWANPKFGELLAGWAFIAPISGALQWRPHIWITGQAGTGKSTVMKKLIRPIQSPDSEGVAYFENRTTEAATRQKLGTDAIPVLWDEIECETADQQDEVQKILFLARSASSESEGGGIVKGSPGGKAVTFRPRSMFCFCSTTPVLKSEPDRTRWTLLRLKPHMGSGEDFLIRSAELLTSEFSARIRRRAIDNIEAFENNLKIIRQAIIANCKNPRSADQLGTLIAGYWVLTHDAIITSEEASRMAAEYLEILSDDMDNTSASDMCLRTLLTAQIQRFTGRRSVSEMIAEIEDGSEEESITRNGITHMNEKASLTLRRYGIIVRADMNEVRIQKDHPQLAQLLGRDYAGSYYEILSRIGKIGKSTQRIDGKIKTFRYISLALDSIKRFE